MEKDAFYIHSKSSGLYQFILVFHNEADGEPHVLYRSVKENVLWGRPLKEFQSKFSKIAGAPNP